MSETPGRRRYGRCASIALVCAALIFSVAAVPAASEASSSSARWSPPQRDDLAQPVWVWPLTGFRVARPYVAPPHAYGPGHRGIDLATIGGSAVRSPARGIIAFVGSIAGRGIITIDHGEGMVSTLEPVTAAVEVGTRVERGEEIGVLSVGGHAAVGTLHFGVRQDGEYINPLLLFGGVPRAVLLPCCDDSS